MNTEGQLTTKLTEQYRQGLVNKLTTYDPNNAVPFADLSLLGDDSTTVTLQKLMTLTRPDAHSRPSAVAEVEDRLGLSRRGKRRAAAGRSRLANAGTAASRARGAENGAASAAAGLDDGDGEGGQRWFKSGGGFMTQHHKGRCCFDPKLMPVNTPGPGNPDTSGVRAQVPGMGFGSSTSSRDLKPIKRRRPRKKDLRPDTVPVARPRPPGSAFVSSGPRYGPTDWLSTELKGGHSGSGGSGLGGVAVHAASQADKTRCSPGPRYNSDKSLAGAYARPPTMKFGTNNRFAAGVNSFIPSSASPGPVYDPQHHLVEKQLPISQHFAGREDFGSTYAAGKHVISPGPAYNPVEADAYLNVAPQFSFGNNASGPVSPPKKTRGGGGGGGGGGRGGRGTWEGQRAPKGQRAGLPPRPERRNKSMHKNIWATIQRSGKAYEAHRPLEYL
jgi:hypothetical protein